MKDSLSNLLMSSVHQVTQQVIAPSETDNQRLKLKYETQAVTVIKEKIAYYKKTNNKHKLAIYESKLKGKRSVISSLRSFLK